MVYILKLLYLTVLFVNNISFDVV